MKWPEIDFEHLRDVNPRTVGWIRLKDTPIDYPVVQGADNSFYLTHNFSDEESVHGCIFALGNESFPDKRCVLFGHAMQDGTMFVALHHYYFDDGFFEAHPTIDLKTESADYLIRVWGAILLTEDYAFMTRIPRTQAHFDTWKKAVRVYSPLRPDFDLQPEDDIMGLCTCRRIPDTGERGTMMIIGKVEKAGERAPLLP